MCFQSDSTTVWWCVLSYMHALGPLPWKTCSFASCISQKSITVWVTPLSKSKRREKAQTVPIHNLSLFFYLVFVLLAPPWLIRNTIRAQTSRPSHYILGEYLSSFLDSLWKKISVLVCRRRLLGGGFANASLHSAVTWTWQKVTLREHGWPEREP